MVDHHVTIVGGGFSGIGLGVSLRARGITDFCILEASDDIGGVWHHNRYPGVAVDIPSTTYSYSFEPNPFWSRLFAPGAELEDYATHVADNYHVSGHVQLGTRVESAEYDERRHRWIVDTNAGQRTTRFLVCAVGPLYQLKYPPIAGIENFTGPVVHSPRWDDTVRLQGRQVGIIGTGASALQLIQNSPPPRPTSSCSSGLGSGSSRSQTRTCRR